MGLRVDCFEYLCTYRYILTVNIRDDLTSICIHDSRWDR